MKDIDDVVGWCSSRKHTREVRTGSPLRNVAGTVIATVLKEDKDENLALGWQIRNTRNNAMEKW